jgi:hypothetical protein
MLLPHLSEFKQLAQWHSLRIVWQLDQGDEDAAAQTTIHLFDLSQTLANEPTLISQLLRLAAANIGMSSMERVLTRTSLEREQLQALRDALDRARPDRAMHVGMMGERCFGLDFMHFNPGQLTAATDINGGQSKIPAADALMLLYRMTGLADSDTRFYLNSLNAYVAAGTNSGPNRLALANDRTLDPRAQGKFAIFSNLLMPALGRAFDKEAQCLTAMAAAETALAVEAYRADHQGELPETLDELVPAYFETTPVDPATEKPLSLVPNAIGYAIHASGPVFTVRR